MPNEELLRKIFESSYDEIFVTDGAGITLTVNAACERLYNLPASQLIGKKVDELERQGLFSPSITPLVLKEKRRITIAQETRTGRKIIVTANPVFDSRGRLISLSVTLGILLSWPR